MPGQYIPHQDNLGSMIEGLNQRIEALATTPSAGNQSIQEGALAILNASNVTEVLVGEYEWPTAPWASNKIYGLIAFGATGHPLVVVGLQPDGAYGLGMYDVSGVRAVFLGDQGSGLYGLAIRNQDGVVQQVGGSVTHTGSSVTLTSGSEVTTTATRQVTLGPSGQAEVTWACSVTNLSSATAELRLYADGSFVGSSIIGPNSQGTAELTKTVTMGSAGLHTFSLRVYASAATGPNPVNYSDINMIVRPL